MSLHSRLATSRLDGGPWPPATTQHTTHTEFPARSMKERGDSGTAQQTGGNTCPTQGITHYTEGTDAGGRRHAKCATQATGALGQNPQPNPVGQAVATPRITTHYALPHQPRGKPNPNKQNLTKNVTRTAEGRAHCAGAGSAGLSKGVSNSPWCFFWLPAQRTQPVPCASRVGADGR
jgi:hypothetical protein